MSKIGIQTDEQLKHSLNNLKKCIRNEIDNNSISFAEIIYYDVKDNIADAICNQYDSLVLYNSKKELMEIFSEIDVSTEEYGKLKALLDKKGKEYIEHFMKDNKSLDDMLSVNHISPKEISLTKMMYKRQNKKNVFFHSSLHKERKEKIEECRDNTAIKIEVDYILEENDSFKKEFDEVMKSISENDKREMSLKDKFDLVKEVEENSIIKEKLVKRFYDKAKFFFDKLLNELKSDEKQFEKQFTFFYHIFHQENMYFYYFINPMFTTNDSIVGDGGLILYCRSPLNEEKIDKIELLFTKWSSVLSAKTYTHKFIKKSTLSAKSAIMSRNLSHNLGSHVMAYLKQYLESVKDIVQRNILVELIKEHHFDNEPVKDLKIDETSQLPFLVGMGRFISYLQERQDFIATICTDYIPYYSTINFKDFIYDELNPDCRSIRHPEVKGRKTDNILLKFIAQSEGLTREFENKKDFSDDEMKIYKNKKNIIIKFREFNGINAKEWQKKCNGINNDQNEECRNCSNYKGCRDLNAMRKFEFSLPGGIVGRQAFFSIIENIIRNAAKHRKREKNKSLELTIDILEEDNLPDLYTITITDNTVDNQGVVKKIKDALVEKYIDEQGKLLETNKGIKEIRISACYLRGIDVTKESEYENTESPILQINNDNNDNLQYIFYVPKSKKIAFVVDKKHEQMLEKYNINLQEYYCKVFTEEEFKYTNRKNYEFIVAQDENVYDNILPCSHSKIVIDNIEEKLIKEFDVFKVEESEKDTFKEINEYLCKLYLKLETVKQVKTICIVDDKEGSKLENNHYKRSSNITTLNDDGLKKYKDSVFCYRKHHDAEDEFKNFMKNIKPGENLKFIESITGSNSTDRLIRRDELNDVWFCRHANAMATKVAIFDERLFTKITGIQQSEIEGDRYENILDTLMQNVSDINIKNTIELLMEEQNKDELLDYCKKTLDTKNLLSITQHSKTHKPLVFRQKNIDFFTWSYDETNRCVIWGLSEDETRNEVNNENYKAKYREIGLFKIIGDEIGIEMEAFKEKYDFITIHQGLLDKVYKELKTKEGEKEDKEKQKKLLLTNKIFEKFSSDTNKANKKGKFLPKFIIHSGRSKPSKKDMPQEQPFIQYSALENAISDCKFSLVELLEQAYYEYEQSATN